MENMKELGDYTVIKKSEYEKLLKDHEQSERKREKSRNYMRKVYYQKKMREEENLRIENLEFDLNFDLVK